MIILFHTWIHASGVPDSVQDILQQTWHQCEINLNHNNFFLCTSAIQPMGSVKPKDEVVLLHNQVVEDVEHLGM